jgi:hypothetical protein
VQAKGLLRPLGAGQAQSSQIEATAEAPVATVAPPEPVIDKSPRRMGSGRPKGSKDKSQSKPGSGRPKGAKDKKPRVRNLEISKSKTTDT